MSHIKAFVLGVWEFRNSCTTSYSSTLLETYDRGRDLAHKLTFRYFDC